MEIEDIERRMAEVAQSDGFGGIVSAYLFGSVAEKRAHAESDIDIGVLLDWKQYPDRRDRFDLRLRLPPALKVTAVPDVVILNDASPEVGRAIVTRGRRVYCSDREADHAFVRDVQLRAADLDPFLRRMRSIKLEALARR